MTNAPVRTPIVAGNWKMHTVPSHARTLARQTVEALSGLDPALVEIVLCPPFVSLAGVREVTAGAVAIGAQNLHWLESGAYTGEVSAPMLAELCTHVIIGHCERRQHFGETDDTVHRKVRAALTHNLTPIVCVGETLAQRQAGETHDFVSVQLRAALAQLEPAEVARVVLAYEPIWAIGTGVAASGSDANAVGEILRRTLAEIAGTEVAWHVRIQYGGSVTAANAAEFLRQPEIDGALVGGASLKPGDFAAIARAATGS